MSQTASGETSRIGVLSLHNSKETKAILNAIDALGHEPVWLREENLAWAVEDGRVTVEPAVDVVVNRLLLTKADRPIEDLALAVTRAETQPVLNRPIAVLRATHKYTATVAMARAGIPVPDSVLTLGRAGIDRVRDGFGARVVQKRAVGTNGNSMSLLGPDDPVLPRQGRRRAFLQEYLEPDGPRPTDLRVYVVGGSVVGAMRRVAPGGEWRTNVARGGEVRDVTDTLPSEPAGLARRATSLFGLDYAGVDLLRHGGSWFVLEVNATAGFTGLFEATGRSVAPHIARLAIERAGGSVEDRHVEAAARRYDTAVPECSPAGPAADGGTQILGLTEEVVVGGGRGTRSVVAKADTGATRTSIDVDLAASIGAGPIEGTTTVRSAVGSSAKSRPLVDVEIGLGDRWTSVTASVVDRDGLSHPVLIGRDILTDYQVDVGRRVDEE